MFTLGGLGIADSDSGYYYYPPYGEYPWIPVWRPNPDSEAQCNYVSFLLNDSFERLIEKI
jgi:hypothetical protein